MNQSVAKLLQEYIAKPLGTYRDEATLTSVLKRRLTKKEYKVFCQLAEGEPSREALMENLALDGDRYTDIVVRLRRKLNYDRIKRDFFE